MNVFTLFTGVRRTYAIIAASVALVSVSMGALTWHMVHQRHAREAAVRDGKQATRDSIAMAAAQLIQDIAPKIVHDTVEVVLWRNRIDHALDSSRLASARVDTALKHLSESAKADTTVRALVGAVTQLQADTARLFAAILTERRAVDSLRVDYQSGLHALGVRVVFVQDSMQRVIDAKVRALHRQKVVTVVTNIVNTATTGALTYLATRKH